MKKILLILFLLALLPLARAQNVTTATVTITNTAGTVNGETFTLNGNTWMFTNDFSNPCSEIIAGTNVFNSASNMWTAIISCPLPNMSVSYNTSNQFQFVSTPGAALTAVLSSGWGTLVYSTNTLTRATIVRVPPSVAGLYEQTNVSSGLATWLSSLTATNQVTTNAPMFALWYNLVQSIASSTPSQTTNTVNALAWTLNGNSPTASQFLGTLNGAPLVFSINGDRNAYFDNNQNVILGRSNYLSGSWNVTLGGYTNHNASAGFGLIGNGISNRLDSYLYETVLNGFGNYAHGEYAQVLNGTQNSVDAPGPGGGAHYGTIINGAFNHIDDLAMFATIINGSYNWIGINSSNAVIIGGTNNLIGTNCQNSTIVGNNNTVLAPKGMAFGDGALVSPNNPFTTVFSDGFPFQSSNSNEFLIHAANGVGINVTNPGPYTLNIGGPVNATAYYLNNQPFSGGGNGTNGTSSSGSVQSLYSYTASISQNYIVSNVVIAGSGYLPANGTYYPSLATFYNSATYNLNYNGNNYLIYGDYTNSTGLHFFWNLQGGIGQPVWTVYDLSRGGAPAAWIYLNFSFNIISPSFNAQWANSAFPPQGLLTPTVSFQSAAVNSAVAISWQQADNWSVPIFGTNYFLLSLIQDWKATNSVQVEYHKIFLSSVTNSSINFAQGTSQWTWQNRQGLAALGPTNISSNEVITISISHLGGNTNWLAMWESSFATNQSQVESGFVMTRSSVSADNTTNYYWWDFGQLNTSGQLMIYATLTATNTVDFIGLTNASIWRLLSFNVVASGSDRVILLPDSLPHLSTNNLTHSAPFYALTLTNGNEFRMTIQTNSTLSTTWATFGQ